jgi:hypothetical protein
MNCEDIVRSPCRRVKLSHQPLMSGWSGWLCLLGFLVAFLSRSKRCSDSTLRQEMSASWHTEGTSLNNARAREESAGFEDGASIPCKRHYRQVLLVWVVNWAAALGAGCSRAPPVTSTPQSALSSRSSESEYRGFPRDRRTREFDTRQQLNWRSSSYNDRWKIDILACFRLCKVADI